MSDQGTQTPPAGWYPDPQGPGNERWFDGQSWTTGLRPVAAPAPAWQPPQEQQPAVQPQETALQLPYQPAVQQPFQQPAAQPFQQPLHQAWQQPEKKGMSTGAKVLIVLASIVVGLVLLGIIAAVAIPVFLSQRSASQAAGLSAVTCEALAGQVATDSAASPTDDGHWVVEVTAVRLIEDARTGVTKPAAGAEEFVMSCLGTAVWDDDLEEPVQIDLFVDSEMERVYYLSWGS